jgi:hypothetical protein
MPDLNLTPIVNTTVSTGVKESVGSYQNGVNAALSATLAFSGTKICYLQGFLVTGAGATAASVINVTITGLAIATVVCKLVVPAGATTSIVPLVVNFGDIGLPASGAGVNIVVSMPAFGAGNTDAAIFAWGYRL